MEKLHLVCCQYGSEIAVIAESDNIDIARAMLHQDYKETLANLFGFVDEHDCCDDCATIYAFDHSDDRINYFDFISGLSDSDCNKALKRILPRIDMRQINELIDNTKYITDLQKQFYKTMISERKEKILDKSLQLLKNKERNIIIR